jgi:ABC-type transporter Mla MlaB component
MLKITELHRTNHEITLKLEGSVTDDVLPEVKTSCEEVLKGKSHLRLDMSDVAFIERRALPFFQSLKDRHVELFNCTPFILEQINTGTDKERRPLCRQC